MRKYKLIILLSIILFFIIFISLTIKENEEKNTISKSDEKIDEYNQAISNLADIEINNENEESIISIVENESEQSNAIIITNKDIEFIKILNTTEEDAKEIAIENKIYSTEAQKKGITLSEDTVTEIEMICNSDEILYYIQNNDIAQDNFKERIKTYLMDIEYTKSLKDKILYEIDNNCISIFNKEINSKMNEYIDLKDSFNNIENPTEKEKIDYLNQIGSLYFEIQNLYLDSIKDKYLVDIK